MKIEPQPCPIPKAKAYLTDTGCNIIIGREIHGSDQIGVLRWHMSISHPSRYPTWEEIRDARYALIPDDAVMVMILPPKKEYVNVHPNCFHLHEIFD